MWGGGRGRGEGGGGVLSAIRIGNSKITPVIAFFQIRTVVR